MAKKKLYPGTGATATILTRFIRPRQPLPDNDKKHRSTVILLGLSDDGKVYTFRYCEDDDNNVMEATTRYVRVEKEGDPANFFNEEDRIQRLVQNEEDQNKEPRIRWEKSYACTLLYKDITNGDVPLEKLDADGNETMPLEEIYASRIEFADYRYDKFAKRLEALRKTIVEKEDRANSDEEAFWEFVQHNPISTHSHKGYIQWQGSESQELAQTDINDKRHKTIGITAMYWERSEYYEEFPLDVFRDKIKQEIRTAKYFHTLEVKGKQHKSS